MIRVAGSAQKAKLAVTLVLPRIKPVLSLLAVLATNEGFRRPSHLASGIEADAEKRRVQVASFISRTKSRGGIRHFNRLTTCRSSATLPIKCLRPREARSP